MTSIIVHDTGTPSQLELTIRSLLYFNSLFDCRIFIPIESIDYHFNGLPVFPADFKNIEIYLKNEDKFFICRNIEFIGPGILNLMESVLLMGEHIHAVGVETKVEGSYFVLLDQHYIREIQSIEEIPVVYTDPGHNRCAALTKMTDDQKKSLRYFREEVEIVV